MADIDKNVFVSHIHEDDGEVAKLKGLLGKQDFNIRNYSVTKDNPNNAHNEDYIKNQILKPRLDASSVVAVIITPDTKKSDWVDWEVEYAVQNEKYIVGIWAHGHSECEAPQSLEDYADTFVSWDSDKIIDALEGEKYEEDCTGKPRPKRKLKPPKCQSFLLTLFSYVVRYDIGFAPNPFFGWCSLACCKPDIRAVAEVGDIVVGTSSTVGGSEPKFVYIMRVTEVLNFQSYWDDPRFFEKRPNLRGSKKQNFGDNIYHRDFATGDWMQEDSRHSNLDGSTHEEHLKKDTGKTENIVISNDFVYWGSNSITIPSQFRHGDYGDDIVKRGQGKKNKFCSFFIRDFEDWFDAIGAKGQKGRPTDWDDSILRKHLF